MAIIHFVGAQRRFYVDMTKSVTGSWLITGLSKKGEFKDVPSTCYN